MMSFYFDAWIVRICDVHMTSVLLHNSTIFLNGISVAGYIFSVAGPLKRLLMSVKSEELKIEQKKPTYATTSSEFLKAALHKYHVIIKQ